MTDDQADVLNPLTFNRISENSAWEAITGRKDILSTLQELGYVSISRQSREWYITAMGRIALKRYEEQS